MSCSWCDRAIERGDGWRLHELPGARRAAFCRLEHVVPWEIQGAHWEAVPPGEEEPEASGDITCAHCGEPLGDVTLRLVRHRGKHRIPDSFCSIGHLAAWAKAGGRWR
ncbi:MAG: hypothetical protein JW895_18230 [Thermoleophilaceae bacterium]|nr:hypothetical protein [Thermoleophilaceae bacterium]